MMLDKTDVAQYFLSLDEEREVFNKIVIEKNGRRFYEGNARLNKIMHLAQNIYIAIRGELLIDAEFYAFDNGAVIPEIQENYARLNTKQRTEFDFDDETVVYLNKIYSVFKNAPIDELIELDHEDPEWKKRHVSHEKNSQKMDPLANTDDYRERYRELIKVMDRMAG